MRHRLTDAGKKGGDDAAAELDCALDGCVLADASDQARLLATGPDYLDLLHRLSTGDVASLETGQGRPTILTTPKGRIVERLFVFRRGERDVLSVGGPGAGSHVIDHLARFTFAEQTGLAEITGESFQFVCLGPEAARILEATEVERPEPFGAVSAAMGEATVHVLGVGPWSSDGFSVVGPKDAAVQVWDALARGAADTGGRTTGGDVLEAWRILRGLPAAGHELTEEHNPLEASQQDAVSFDKGCYVGQEVVARLRTYDKVSRVLVGLEFPEGAPAPALGTTLLDADRAVGDLTSVVIPPGRSAPVGLAYLKRKTMRPDLSLRAGDGPDAPTARVVDLPFPL